MSRLVAIVHMPWYSSNAAHYREVECLRQALEVRPLGGVQTACSVIYCKGITSILSTGEAADQGCGRMCCTQQVLTSSSPPTSMRCAEATPAMCIHPV